jgi:uncharacterized protein YnzC (UPF0291/DUF896 family)
MTEEVKVMQRFKELQSKFKEKGLTLREMREYDSLIREVLPILERRLAELGGDKYDGN